MKYKIILLIILVAATLLLAGCSKSSPEVVDFAKCVTDNGAKMFGAYWCPHCKEQKEEFGDQAFAELDYIECSLPGGQGQTAVCQQAGITGYPTWEFADGERVPGRVSWQELSLKTGCPLP